MANTEEPEEICEEEVKKDILDVLKNIREGLKERSAQKLHTWSNHVIHCASIHTDLRAVYVSIITYALAKIIEKEESMRNKPEWADFINGMLANIDALIELLERNEMEKFDSALNDTMKIISEFDKSFSKYVQRVLEFAKIQKGAKIHEHGLSLSSVAQMIGVSKWDLMEKIGETKVSEVKAKKTTRERYEEVKKIMKKE